MNQAGEMANEVDVALQRVRGELATLERALAVLRTSIIDETGASVDLRNEGKQPIGSAFERVSKWRDLDGVGRVLSRDLWLPEYGASLPLDEQA